MLNPIRSQIIEIYRASGYTIDETANPSTFTAARQGPNGGKEEVVVALPLEVMPRPGEDEILSQISRWQPNGNDRVFVVALPKSLSLGAAFQSRVTNANAEIRHYSGLLDGGYGGKYIGLGSKDHRAPQLRNELFDYSRVDADLLSAVVRASEAEKALSRPPTRVPQRYFIRDGASVANRRTEGADLLRYLVARLGQPAYSPEVFLIVGPGGSGKSWLFEGLFTYLEEALQKRKNKQEPTVRPIPIVPAGLIAAGSRSATDLFEAVARAEYGSRGGIGLMDHLVRTGQALLLFDGLDEFFADNHDIGQLISKRYFTPDSQARIFIVLRDSLLDTSENVQTLCERFKSELGVEGFTICEIAPWEPEIAQRELAWLKLEQRHPHHGEKNTPAVEGFLDWLGQSPRLQQLAGLAFYCDLLLDLYIQDKAGAVIEQRSGRLMPVDEYELLELCFDLVLDRELAKQQLDTDVIHKSAAAIGLASPEQHSLWTTIDLFLDAFFGRRLVQPVEAQLALDASGSDPYQAWRLGIVELVEEAAYFSRRKPHGMELTTLSLRQLHEKLELGVDRDLRALGERMLRQFVLFVQGRKPGTVDFAHEFMADFLAARYVVKRVKGRKDAIEILIGQPTQGETDVFQGYLKRELHGTCEAAMAS
jgi:hypothetical protein